MKIIQNIKSGRGQATLIGIVLYIIGIICEVFRYMTVGLKGVSFIFLTVALVYNIALFNKWADFEGRVLKLARVTLFFIVVSLIIIFVTWFNKMYFTFGFTIIFAGFLAFFFFFILAEICSMYNDLDKGE